MRVKLVGEMQVVWAFMVFSQKTVFLSSGEVCILEQLFYNVSVQLSLCLVVSRH